jgi:endonuclease/exonuclease/phosphatase family metal-dependent hydrolase
MRTQYGDRWLGFDPEEVKKWIKSVGFDVLHYQELPAQKGLVVFLIISQKPLHS